MTVSCRSKCPSTSTWSRRARSPPRPRAARRRAAWRRRRVLLAAGEGDLARVVLQPGGAAGQDQVEPGPALDQRHQDRGGAQGAGRAGRGRGSRSKSDDPPAGAWSARWMRETLRRSRSIRPTWRGGGAGASQEFTGGARAGSPREPHDFRAFGGPASFAPVDPRPKVGQLAGGDAGESMYRVWSFVGEHSLLLILGALIGLAWANLDPASYHALHRPPAARGRAGRRTGGRCRGTARTR